MEKKSVSKNDVFVLFAAMLVIVASVPAMTQGIFIFYIFAAGRGLAASRKLCRLMGGDITVESVYKLANVFTVVIPQGIRDAAPIGSVKDRIT